MNKARARRAAGNEGRARVCVRRAPGLALAASANITGRPNAYETMRRAARPQVYLNAAREAAARLCVRVTEAHRLPHLEDPLEDARLLGPTLTSRVDGQWFEDGPAVIMSWWCGH